ncbi:Two-component sensor histidine kinase, contains HisKA and HATPase domains [Bauldia litoralis]|uniref:histidine kinase n=2 Tax=Bauldia litoralis TaxID=665467 RepID=A0A1G6EMU4_9HYPH|nr:Two-component sensor histidine kinase, contains HisKA and HATPase domains [Bauldia litoralis]
MPGGGEMGERIRAFDWGCTPLGTPSSWPQSLKTAAGLMLNSGYPMYIAWGSNFIQLYNDAYRPILGDSKHPASLGASTEHTFVEIWDDIGPMFRSVLEEAKPSTFTDLMLPLNRYGFAEECFFVFSYSPILLENGSSGGVFVTVLETTDRVLRERRQEVVKDIASIHAQGSREGIFCRAVGALGASPGDAPFSAVCGRDGEGAWIVIARDAPCPLSNETILNALEQAQWDRAPATPIALHESVVCPVWPEPVTHMVSRPILAPGAAEAAGIIVFGVSPRLRWDAEYSAFCDTCASNLAIVIADFEAFAGERQRNETLAAIDRAKTVFFSNVSHEFRTPLTLMLGPLEDALAEASLDDRQRDRLSTVYRNALRLQRLVNTLLDFSRIEAGRAAAVFQPTDFIPFITDLVSSFRSATDRAGLELAIDAKALAQAVFIDRDMWENIILNLLSNAFKFTLEGAIRVEIGAAHDGRSVVLTVRDTGMGIPEHELPRLFERFHRAEGVTGRSIEGSGIGLALVRELVALHGGDLTVASKVGEGTAITITIPFGKDHLPADHISPATETASLSHRYSGFVAEAMRWLPSDATGENSAIIADDVPRISHGAADQRVLVVDDNADMRDYLRHLLQWHGYRVDVAADGLVALEMIERAPPDLVLSDLMMPNLDGFGLLVRLRKNPATRELPFIALSARAGEESKIEGLEAGADDYLVKPFSSRELFARVSAAIKLARMRRTARESLRDEYTRLRRLFEKAPGFMATLRGPDHVFEFANPAYLRIVGDRDIIGKPVASALPEVVEQGFVELLNEVYRTGKPFIGENVRVQLQTMQDAPRREVVVNFVYEPVTDADGTIVGVFLEGHDVTPQHRANQHLQLLISELNHRVKNMLAIVQSVAQQTFKGERNAEVERKAFEGRLTALASAHDILTRQNWESPMLETVAREVIGFHADYNAVSISGPPVRLNPKTAVTLAMALHELCTNALKYGALSIAGGSITLCWEIKHGSEPRLAMTWRERGGPKVKAPSRRGFGSRLIERALATELRGTARLDFRPEGIFCQIDAPLPEDMRS